MSNSRIPIPVPVLGESLTEATVGQWFKQPGDIIHSDEILVELETDKVTLEVHAPTGGTLASINFKKGEIIKKGQILGYIEEKQDLYSHPNLEKSHRILEQTTPIVEPVLPEKQDDSSSREATDRLEKRVPLSKLRQRIAERLKEAQNTAAILTTFNEIDMSTVQNLRQHYREEFEKKHGIKLGLMSFFIKASLQALQEIPLMNSHIEGDEIVYQNYYDIGIAVSAPHGLVVPVIRNADQLDYAGIEKTIHDVSQKARNNKLSIEDLSGGTFTISNGGIFGSLLSTPILNPPQSGILGLHKIQDRPIALNGHVEIRPMMYVALSYDHRLIDGREAVTFLGIIKESLENPGRFLLDL